MRIAVRGGNSSHLSCGWEGDDGCFQIGEEGEGNKVRSETGLRPFSLHFSMTNCSQCGKHRGLK